MSTKFVLPFTAEEIENKLTVIDGSKRYYNSNEIDGGFYRKSTIETKLSLKQPLLTFDNTPKQNSNNPVTSGGLYDAIVNVTEIAEGKRKSYVFDDTAELDTWLANTENTENLQIGDVFLLRSTIEPDYWWDGSDKEILDTNIDLAGYARTDYVDEKFGDIDTAIAQLEALIGGASE